MKPSKKSRKIPALEIKSSIFLSPPLGRKLISVSGKYVWWKAVNIEVTENNKALEDEAIKIGTEKLFEQFAEEFSLNLSHIAARCLDCREKRKK